MIHSQYVLISTEGPDGQLFWYNVSVAEAEFDVELVSVFTLPQAKHRWSTAVALLPDPSELLICGDRRGSVHLYVKGWSNELYCDTKLRKITVR